MKNIRYTTAGMDGYVKIWNAITMNVETEIKVTNGCSVTCLAHMEGSN